MSQTPAVSRPVVVLAGVVPGAPAPLLKAPSMITNSRTLRIFFFLLAWCLAACSSNAQTAEPITPTPPAEAVPAPETGDSAVATQAAPDEARSAAEPAEDAATTPAAPAVAAEPGSKEELLQRVRAMLEQFIAAVQSNEGDCDAMADSLAVVVEGNRDLSEQMKTVENDPEAKAWFDEQGKVMMEELMPRMMTVFQAAQACEGNPKMQKVMQDFSSLGS